LWFFYLLSTKAFLVWLKKAILLEEYKFDFLYSKKTEGVNYFKILSCSVFLVVYYLHGTSLNLPFVIRLLMSHDMLVVAMLKCVPMIKYIDLFNFYPTHVLPFDSVNTHVYYLRNTWVDFALKLTHCSMLINLLTWFIFSDDNWT